MTTVECVCKTGGNARGLIASAVLLSKPGILTLAALAGFTGMVMAVGGLPDVGMSILCVLCLLMAAAGSAMINGVLDAPLDMRMQRVQARVEALEELGRTRVLFIAAVFIGISTVISFVCFNALTAFLVLTAALSYIFLYTLWFKRRSPFGVVPGGIPGALPVLIGYAAVAHTVGPDGLILFFIILLWQPPHFLTLAMKYREDYQAAGVPVMPVVMGMPYTKAFIFLYIMALLPASLSLGFFGYCSVLCAGYALLLGVLFIAAFHRNVIQRPNFGRAFRVSIWYLALLLFGVITDICCAHANLRECTVWTFTIS
jgi:protoheme IX farnesyltransferase